MTTEMATPLAANGFELPKIQTIGPLVLAGASDQLARLPRKLAGLLVLNTGKAVSYQDITEELWGEGSPVGQTTIQTYVMRVRELIKRIEGAELVTVLRGYRLEVSEQLDIQRFQDGMQKVHALMRSQQFAEAESLIADLRELSSKPLLDDVDHGEQLCRHVARYNDYRRTMLKYLCEIMVRQDRDEEIVDDLYDEWRWHPECEDLTELLMLVLHRCRRSVLALDVYHTTRKLLCESHGIDPNPALHKMYSLVLNNTYPLSLDNRALAG